MVQRQQITELSAWILDSLGLDSDSSLYRLYGGVRVSFFFLFLNIYLFIWLGRVLVVACGIFTAVYRIFSCGTWEL